MNNEEIEKYLNTWLLKENKTRCVDQKNLFSKDEYERLLKSVIDTIKDNTDKSLKELREILYQKSGLEDKIKFFIQERGMTPGLVLSYGTNDFKETIITGYSQEVYFTNNGNKYYCPYRMKEDTIFDLASITKLFTSISILKLVQFGLISLDDKVQDIVPKFKNLKDVTVYDLLAFQVPLKTTSRIDRANSKDEAEDIIYNIEIDQENDNKKPYTDMGAMVLKYVIEEVTSIPYYNFLDTFILKPNGLNNTYVTVPNEKIDNVASTNGNGLYYKDGNYVINENPRKGVVFDPKAIIMDQEHGNLSGHAGLFSNASDMTTLAKQLINHNILNEKLLRELAKNRTGKKYIEDKKTKFIQYLGYLCYSKNPNLPDSEVYHALSGEAFASAGWCGTQLTVDPLNEIYFFLGGNRSHNRMTFIDPSQQWKIKQYRNKKTIILPNGEEMIDATRFAWDRDSEIVHPAIRLTIQYKMLEDIIKKYENYTEQDHKVKII